MSIFQSKKIVKQSQYKNHLFLKFVVLCLVLGGIFWGGSELHYHTTLTKTVSQDSKKISVDIFGSVSHIAQTLEENNIAVSAKSLEKYLIRNNLDNKIQAGENIFSSDMTIPEIAEKLLHAVAKTTPVRIPEGYTLAEVDAYFVKKNIFSAGEFLECIEKTCDFSEFSFLPEDRSKWEGYFFPIYNYPIETKKITPFEVAKTSLQVFETVAKRNGAFDDPKRSLSDLVIMASLIEKESSTYEGEESSMISDVLWKRIDENIALGVDATIRYALGIKSKALTRKNLQENNAFNTRKNRGLPPHAISNFSEHSLISAIHPKPNLFYYYLHYKKKIYYGKTNAEHEQNKQKYCGGSCE